MKHYVVVLLSFLLSVPKAARADEGDGLTGGEVAGVVAVGVGTYLVSGAVILGATLGAAEGCDGDFCGLGHAFIGIGVAGLLMPPIVSGAMTEAGDAMGGDGSYWATLGGMYGGLLLGTGLFAASESEATGVIGFAILPLAGATLGYVLSDSSGDEPRSAASGLLHLDGDAGWALGVPAVGAMPRDGGVDLHFNVLSGSF